MYTQDQIFTLRQIVEKLINKKVHLCFVDFENTVDIVARKEILKIGVEVLFAAYKVALMIGLITPELAMEDKEKSVHQWESKQGCKQS